MEENGKGRSYLNEDGIMDFRKYGLNDKFYVKPGQPYIDLFGVKRYGRSTGDREYDNEPSDIISVKKMTFTTKSDSIDDITRGSKPNRHGGYNGFGADPDERF